MKYMLATDMFKNRLTTKAVIGKRQSLKSCLFVERAEDSHPGLAVIPAHCIKIPNRQSPGVNPQVGFCSTRSQTMPTSPTDRAFIVECVLAPRKTQQCQYPMTR
jgi:hypothetical protein